MQASDIISAAKRRAYPHGSLQQVPDRVLLSRLNSADSKVVNRIAQEAPGLLSEESSKISVTDSENQDGYSLNDAVAYTHFELVDESSDDHARAIRILDGADLHQPPTHPSGVVGPDSSGYAFYPADPQEEGWTTSGDRYWFDPDDHAIRYRYVPEHTELTSLSDTLDSPPVARQLFEQAVVVQIKSSQPIPPPDLEQEIQAEQRSWQRLWMQLAKMVEENTTTSSDRKGGVPITEKIIS